MSRLRETCHTRGFAARCFFSPEHPDQGSADGGATFIRPRPRITVFDVFGIVGEVRGNGRGKLLPSRCAGGVLCCAAGVLAGKMDSRSEKNGEWSEVLRRDLA